MGMKGDDDNDLLFDYPTIFSIKGKVNGMQTSQWPPLTKLVIYDVKAQKALYILLF